MTSCTHSPRLNQSPEYVKSPPQAAPRGSPGSMIHHNEPGARDRIIIVGSKAGQWGRYGVSRSRRIISPQTILRRFDQIRRCLAGPLGLSRKERDVVLELLRLWSYYEEIYPKADQVARAAWCGRATYWRTVRMLEDRGLITVINRYLVREEAQISNLYRLDKLIIVLAKYLAEHGLKFAESWIRPYLMIPWPDIWRLNFDAARASPAP